MKKKNLIYAIAGVIFCVLFISILFVLSNYQIQFQEKINKLFKLRQPISGKCGIENCHGLDISCGPNIAEVCTEIYQAGDNCRQFASCQVVNGQCKLIRSSKFDSCKSCVEKCERDYQNDQIKFFECESKCPNQ